MLDLHRLRLLREVHGRGTVHGAARALGYTPSAISQQLAVLEPEAGTALLERIGRNVRLTVAGQVLVRHATVLLDGLEAAEAELASVTSGRPAGLVRVAAFQS
ncbi:MAG TPA: LysR family transcriptional regulator, partial [Pseudonocardia sp.]|nr:LysR family transcriptional regulator [Pseudonocardia sp.]